MAGGTNLKRMYEKILINGKHYKLVTEDKVTYKTTNGRLENGIRCTMEGFYIAPGKVFCVEGLNPQYESDFFDFMKGLVSRGATTFLAITQITHEGTFEKELSDYRHSLRGSPIDYVVGVRIESNRITPEIMRKCARHRVPLVIMEFKSEESWRNSVLEWIIQANFPYRAAIVPDFAFLLSLPKDKMDQEKLVLAEEACMKGFDFFQYNPNELIHEFTDDAMKRIGLYPVKGCLSAGSDFDYNLYKLNSGNRVEEEEILDYDGIDPIISGLRGVLLKVNQSIMLKPGYGKHLLIHKPAFFTANHRNKIRSVRRSFGAWSVLNRLSH